MELGGATAWWVMAGVLVVAELATGTFYLLMLAVGAAAAALAAHAGLGSTWQLVTAAVAGGGAVAVWHLRRQRGRRATPPPSANRDLLLDIGERVVVAHWHADGTARVTHRGSPWAARWHGAGAPVAGELVIRALDGNCLLLDRAEP